ncbi:MAG TPA: hypothetical protein VMZ90_07245 [Vicinamibacterales bacterium]|nr:hypothetical protein [Vicinamibacterales bacterium]
MARRVRIAIFENHRDTAMLLGEFLEAEGFEPVYGPIGPFARTLAAVRDILTVHQPDVVLWDVDFPYLPQCKFFTAVRAEPEFGRLPVVLSTTSRPALTAACGDIVRGLAILQKPFLPDELLSGIEALLRPGHA